MHMLIYVVADMLCAIELCEGVWECTVPIDIDTESARALGNEIEIWGKETKCLCEYSSTTRFSTPYSICIFGTNGLGYYLSCFYSHLVLI